MVPKHVAASIDRWFDKDDELTFFERITLQQEGEEKYLDEPFAIRFGHILEHVVSNMSIIINEGERIVGSVKEIIPSAEEREWAESLSRKWWGDHVSEEQRQESVSYYFSPGWVKRRNPKFFSLGHLAYDWETLITEGLGSYIQRVESIIEKGTYADDPDRSDFLRGALIAYNAHVLFIKRYADHAENLSALTVDQGERNRFKEIAERCAHIAEGKPRTFAEALQLIWFVALISQKIAGCGVFNFSRMDQYLKPFYDNDIAKKKLDPELALELIIEFYAKNNEIMFLADHMSQETEAVIKNLELTYDDPNYITLAGKLADGTSGVNELSFLFIRASALLKLKNPFVVVRWHDGISSSFFKEVVNAMRKNATIVIYNDETMLPALEEFGIEWSDAIDYGFYGCNDPSIGALEGGLRQLWMNLVWPYELALNGGIPFGNPDARAEDNFSLKDRIQIGLMSGYVAGRAFDTDEPVKSMEAFIELYREQMVFLLEQYRTIMEQDYKKETKWNAGKIRIEDLFLRGTIEHGETWITGGTKYHKVTIQGSGLATAINSLAAIDEAVFIQKRYTLDQLREAVATNFEGHTEMRTYLLLLPKFGNDDERVDRYAPIVVNAFADAV
ncbi:MAG: hypothetical protein GX904_00485, partial [Acholeplasmataceae bacterium]|nr:hypothetical protein [Acholeplasmataceae bacterium]